MSLQRMGRRIKAGLIVCLLVCLSWTARAQEDEVIRLSYLFSDGNLPGTLAAYQQLSENYPGVARRLELQFLSESFYDSTGADDLLGSHLLVLDMMNQQMLDRFDEEHGVDLIQQISRQGRVLLVGSGLQPMEYFTAQGAESDDQAMAYWQTGGQQNQYALMLYALRMAGVEGLDIPAPEPGLEAGYYYPDEQGGGQVFADWDSFQAWREDNGKTADGKARVAIGFYRAAVYGSETDVVDALVAEVERQGAEAIPLFGYPGHVAYEQLLLDENGQARADVALSLFMRFADFDSSVTLSKIDIPQLNMITLYGRDEEEWRNSPTGLSMFEGTFQVAVPELTGLIAPVVVGSREKMRDELSGISYVVNQPIHARIEMAVQRGLRYARLRHKENSEKRIALMYYNYPSGKASIGASYLNIADSLSLILQRMAEEGYDLGEANLSADAILKDMTESARNVGGYAPGELEELVAAGASERISMSRYRQWLQALSPPLRDKILSDWGAPEDSRLMVLEEDSGSSLVVPALRYGNILLMPQPARGWGEDLEALYHANDLAPPHQYVAAYRWLAEEVDVDAIVHMGTHGTLEWLDGKDMGLNEDDAPDALIADIPNLYIYNVDVVGEGLVARRRSMATLLDHMVPTFVESDLYPELAALGERINDYDNNLHKNPELAEHFAGDIVEQVLRLGIDKSLGLALGDAKAIDDDTVHRIQDHLLELKGQFIPYGLHAFGRLPTEDMIDSTVNAILAVDRSLLPDQHDVLAEDMAQRITFSASRELDNLLHAMAGGYIPGGSGGEPIRNPDAYPTGKNFYGIDPEKVPKKAAWSLGVQLADQMIAQHLEKHGEYPRKISFVIWGDETMRHEGVLESQIFHLLGTRPIWNERDKVVGVEVIPSAQLGRPRIDILIASAAEGMFNNVTVLMDEAVQKVKALEEAENYVRDHYLATRARLIDMGYSEEDADRRAGVRIFDEPPGIFNLNTSVIAAASGTWDSDIGMANDYINKMGHGFGNGFWGEPMQDVFKIALEGVEKVVHSSSTMLYGALDNDDFYMYMGGLASAVRSVDGSSPELLVTNTRDPGKPEMSSIDKFIGMEFSSRYINPRWIEGMQGEGYAGARAMVEFVEYLWGWDATVSEVVNDRMWQDVFEVYVEDRYDLAMQDFFNSSSPYAFQDISARMMETIRKDYWQADKETLDTLLQAYLSSVEQHGINCTEVSCGNPRLMEFVLEQGRAADLPVPLLDTFRAAVEQAVKGNIEELARAQEAFAQQNDARITAMYGVAPGNEALQGYRMEQLERASRPQAAPGQPLQPGRLEQGLGWGFQALILLLLLLIWRQRRASAVKAA